MKNTRAMYDIRQTRNGNLKIQITYSGIGTDQNRIEINSIT